VAEHGFQEPIPNSPLLLSYLSFGARFLQESRLTTEEFILAFWLRCGLFHGNGASQEQGIKNGFCLFKKNPVDRFFSSFAHFELTLNPSVDTVLITF